MLGYNMDPIYMTERPDKHSRMKHIENTYNVSRDLAEKKEIRVQHVGANGMVTDIMMKVLGFTKFKRFPDMLKVLPLKEPS